MFAFRRLRVLLANLQVVVVSEFVAEADIAARFDENPVTFLLYLAVGRARVIDPARRVAPAGRIDN